MCCSNLAVEALLVIAAGRARRGRGRFSEGGRQRNSLFDISASSGMRTKCGVVVVKFCMR